MNIRLAKFVADCGVASRRVAEDLIKSGRVSVDDKVIDTPLFFVEGNEKVCVDGKIIKRDNETKLYMFHKPLNTVTTARDPQNRRTIYDVLPKQYRNLKYIGRLDYKTTGLLLLTNDGDLARKMSLPENQIPRTYIAKVSGFTQKGLNVARNGVVVDGIKYRPMKIEVISQHDLKITVVEGKKNEIRIVLKHIGSPVIKLHRVTYGPIKLGKLGVGKILELDKKTVDLISKNF